MVVNLVRHFSDKDGTFGSVFIFGKLFCFSLEKADLNNQPNISCIPEGEYVCTYKKSPKFGDCYHLENVKNRSGILIHSANLERQLLGCIALGSSIGILEGQKAVLNSKATVKSLEDVMGRKTFRLIISRK